MQLFKQLWEKTALALRMLILGKGDICQNPLKTTSKGPTSKGSGDLAGLQG